MKQLAQHLGRGEYIRSEKLVWLQHVCYFCLIQAFPVGQRSEALFSLFLYL